MKIRSLLAVSALILTTTQAFAQGSAQAQAQAQQAAQAAFQIPEVAQIVSIAATARKLDPQTIADARTRANSITAIDCSINPKPYNQPDKSKCGFKARLDFGWYADPVLVIEVSGYVPASKATSGTIAPSDIQIASVNVKIPDPTGLE